MISSYSFMITADAIMSSVRNLQKEGLWCDALSTLNLGLQGSSLEQCVEVLKGNHGIEGDSNKGLSLVEEEPSFSKNIEESYTKKFFYEGGYVFEFVKVYQEPQINAMLSNSDFEDYEAYEMLQAEISRKEIIFEIDEKIYLVAKEVDNNAIPFWYEKNIFANSACHYFENYYPEDLKVKSIEEKVKVACEERNVSWKEYVVERENGKKVKYNVPMQIMLGYLNKSNSYWKPISSPGEKMYGDCPFHTDLWIALGNDLEEWDYSSKNPKVNDFYDLVETVRLEQVDAGDFSLLVSAKLNNFKGKIVFEDSPVITDRDILILPNANVKYESLALKSGLVIVETGSALSHLVMMNKNTEMAPLCILRVKDALSKFKDFASLKIDFENNKITGSYYH